MSTQAEANESRDRLKLLGMNEEEFSRLDRSRQIRSVVPIVAPFGGRIIGRKLTRGEVVETTEKLFVIADLSEVWVQANIPEKDIAFVHSIHASGGTQVEVRINAYPKEVFKGRITYVGDILDPVTRTMQLRSELPNQDGRFKPEMFATIRLFSEAQPDRLAVPEAALQRDQGRTFVFVQRNANEYELREVRVGESNGTCHRHSRRPERRRVGRDARRLRLEVRVPEEACLMVSRLLDISLRQKLLIIIFAVVMGAGGIYAFRTIPIDAFPDVTSVLVQVVTKAPGLSPAEVERLVTYPIELQLTGVPSLTEMRSLTKVGSVAHHHRVRRLHGYQPGAPTGARTIVGSRGAASSGGRADAGAEQHGTGRGVPILLGSSSRSRRQYRC